MSNIQFNLLPNVKLEYIKAQKTRQKVVNLAVLISGASLAILFMLILLVYGLQKKQLSDAAGQITSLTNQVKATSGLDKALTVQNQLQTLVNLHSSKHDSSRIFTYLSQLTPPQTSLNNLNLDMTNTKLTIDGTADTQSTVNTFIDTLKFTKFKVASGTAQTAFSSVLETGFSINPNNVNFTLNISFAPQLFANNLVDSNGKPVAPTLQIPSQSTTRDPSSVLFNTSGGSQ